MEPKITDEELKLLDALYWWQMTGNWPRRTKDKIFSLITPRSNLLPKEKYNSQ
jgi:hypothetical protein